MEETPQLIGEGVYGTVHKVTQAIKAQYFPNVEYPVACKSIPHHKGGAVIMHDTAVLEILCSRYLHDTGTESPGAVRYIRVDIGPADTKLFMRKYSNTLEQYMSDHKPNPGVIRRIMHHLMQGVHSLHKAGIVHRDIKPSNIFMDDPRTVVVGDYGFAVSVQHINKSSPANAMVQTEPYRAPEVFLGQTAYGTEIDMWSVGCVMFELFNQRRLLEVHNPECYMKELFAIVGSSNPTGPSLPGWGEFQSSGVPAERGYVLKTRDKKADNLLRALLNVDPAQRITAADALNHEYFGCYRLDRVKPLAPTVWEGLPATAWASSSHPVPKGAILYNAKNRHKVFTYVKAANEHFELSAGNYFFTCDLADAFFRADTIPKQDIKSFVYVCTYLATALRDNVSLAPDYALELEVADRPRALLDMQLKILKALKFDLRVS